MSSSASKTALLLNEIRVQLSANKLPLLLLTAFSSTGGFPAKINLPPFFEYSSKKSSVVERSVSHSGTIMASYFIFPTQKGLFSLTS